MPASTLTRESPIEERAPQIVRILSKTYPTRGWRCILAAEMLRDDPVGAVHRREGNEVTAALFPTDVGDYLKPEDY
jgi:hypothetical protein